MLWITLNQGLIQKNVTISDVDITYLSSEESGGQVTFTLRVAGEIKDYTANEQYRYFIWATESETASQSNGVMVYYEDGESMYVSYIGGSTSGAPATSSVSGDTLELTVPESAFSTMSSFDIWAMTGYENTDTGAGAVDQIHSWDWDTDGTNGGSGSTDNSDGNETAENIIEKYILGSMLCIALSVIIPLIIIVIIIVVVLKVLKSDEGSEQPPQQQAPPPSQQPPSSGQQQQSPPPPNDESSDDW